MIPLIYSYAYFHPILSKTFTLNWVSTCRGQNSDHDHNADVLNTGEVIPADPIVDDMMVLPNASASFERDCKSIGSSTDEQLFISELDTDVATVEGSDKDLNGTAAIEV